MMKNKFYILALLLTVLVSYSCTNLGDRLPSSQQGNDKLTRAMGLNMSAPQSEQKLVSAPVMFANIFQTSRPFVEHFYHQMRTEIQKGGLAKIRELKLRVDAEDAQLPTPLSGFHADKYIYRYAQQNRNNFPQYGVNIHHDKSATLYRKGASVTTTLLESARQGDVPNGVYSLYVSKDVSVNVSGIGRVVSCNGVRDYASVSDVVSTGQAGLKPSINIAQKARLKEMGIDIDRNCKYPEVYKKKLGFWARLWAWIKRFLASLFGQNYTQKIQAMPDCKVIDQQERLEKEKRDNSHNHQGGHSNGGGSNNQGGNSGQGGHPSAGIVPDTNGNQIPINLSQYGQRVCIDVRIPQKPDIEGLRISFTARKKTELKNIKMIMPNIANGKSILQGKVVFNPAYINYIKDFKVLRVMNMINASPRPPRECVYAFVRDPQKSWNIVEENSEYGKCLMKFHRTPQNRAKLGDLTWGNSYLTPLEHWRGVPYEVLVDLAKETKSDLWVNIPHNASVEYIKNMADYFTKHYPKNQKITLEYSNEVWNGGFWGQKYMIGLANKRKVHYRKQALLQVEKYVSKKARLQEEKFGKEDSPHRPNFAKSYREAYTAYRNYTLPMLEKEMPDLDSYWNGYISARKNATRVAKGLKAIPKKAVPSYNPDHVSQFNSDEIMVFERRLKGLYNKGFTRGLQDGISKYDVVKEAEIHIKKRLLRAYQYIANLAYVDQVAKIHNIWIRAGFPKERLITVLATKQSNPGLTEIMLEYADTMKYLPMIDGIATGAYFYGCLGRIDSIESGEIGECLGTKHGIMSVQNAHQLLDILEDPKNPKGVRKVKEQMEDQIEMIKTVSDKIKLLVYEGGHHLTTSLAKRKQIIHMKSTKGRELKLLKIFRTAVEHPRMSRITEELYDAWMEIGGTTFINFDMAHGYHKWGAFGLSESVSDKNTPRYKSAVKYSKRFQ